ncbi:hypothetical protein HYV64_00610 [Candidatus Shapirobacteria bacterium]|nr:hypothetical protein [Candidatus Shapirobacteria bacterium]
MPESKQVEGFSTSEPNSTLVDYAYLVAEYEQQASSTGGRVSKSTGDICTMQYFNKSGGLVTTISFNKSTRTLSLIPNLEE